MAAIAGWIVGGLVGAGYIYGGVNYFKERKEEKKRRRREREAREAAAKLPPVTDTPKPAVSVTPVSTVVVATPSVPVAAAQPAVTTPQATQTHATPATTTSSTIESGPFKITVKTLTSKTHEVPARSSTTICEVMTLVEKADGTPTDKQRIIFEGKQLEEDKTLADYGVNDGDMLYLALRLRGGKPVVYLYDGEKKVGVPFTATLTFNEAAGTLACAYPAPATNGATAAWSGTYDSDGAATTLHVGGKDVPSLFWELDIANAAFFANDEKWVVCKGAAKLATFERVLARSGLSERERNEMVVYWLRFLSRHDAVAVRRFAIEKAVGLAVDGFDTAHRVFLVMKGVTPDEESEMVASGDAVGVDDLAVVERPTGKFVVEWGAVPLN